MKKLFVVLMVFFSTFANAGFLTGVVVGSAMSSGGNKESSKGSATVFSDNHDVIFCFADFTTQYECHVETFFDRTRNLNRNSISPAEFAARAGYKILHKVGITVITGTQAAIIMEVSK